MDGDTLFGIQAYVTTTEWRWMHGIKKASCIKEIDLTRPEVYLCGSFLWTQASGIVLLERGSLATLQTHAAQTVIGQHFCESYLFWTPTFMRQPLSVIQYCVQKLQIYRHVVHSIWIAAVLGGRRDVLLWMQTIRGDELTILFPESLLIRIVRAKQGKVIRWLEKNALISEGACMWRESVCLEVVKTRQFKFLRWLRRKYWFFWNQAQCLVAAEKHGYVRMAEWIKQQKL